MASRSTDKRTAMALNVRRRLLTNVGLYAQAPSDDIPLSASSKGAMVGRLNAAFGDDVYRQIVLSWLFTGVPNGMSSKQLTDPQWMALYNWIGFWRDEDGWHVSDQFNSEALVVFYEALRARSIMVGDQGTLIEQAAGFGMSVTPDE